MTFRETVAAHLKLVMTYQQTNKRLIRILKLYRLLEKRDY